MNKAKHNVEIGEYAYYPKHDVLYVIKHICIASDTKESHYHALNVDTGNTLHFQCFHMDSKCIKIPSPSQRNLYRKLSNV